MGIRKTRNLAVELGKKNVEFIKNEHLILIYFFYRFMIQDAIDLRKNRWQSRRQDSNPKTIDQIQKEAENEQLNIQAMNSVPLTPRKDDRGGSAGPSSDRKKKTVSDDGWQTASRNRAPFTVQSDKLKNKPVSLMFLMCSLYIFFCVILFTASTR